MSDTAAMITLALRIATPAIMLITVILCFLSLSFGRRDEHALIALDDEDNNIRYPVLFWENTLGRSRNSDIRVPDATVSRDHAVLLRREEGWFITDTGSKSSGALTTRQMPTSAARSLRRNRGTLFHAALY